MTLGIASTAAAASSSKQQQAAASSSKQQQHVTTVYRSNGLGAASRAAPDTWLHHRAPQIGKKGVHPVLQHNRKTLENLKNAFLQQKV
jgi:hypothetical protein